MNKRFNGEILLRGMVYIFAVFQLLSVPAIYGYMSLKNFSLLLLMVLLGLGIGWFIWSFRKHKFPKRHISTEQNNICIWNILAIVLILFQLFMAVAYANINDDDAFYVAASTTAVETNSLYVINPYTGDPFVGGFPARYVLSPFPLLYSVISCYTGISATIVAHIIMHFVFIAAAYGVYSLIAKELYKDDLRKQGIFLTSLCVVNICSLGAEHLQGSMLLLRIWQGKAVLAAILLPYVLLQLWRMHEQTPKKRDYFFLTSLMLACCFVSSMGIVLGAIAVGVYALAGLLLKHNGKQFSMTVSCVLPNVIYALIYVRIR